MKHSEEEDFPVFSSMNHMCNSRPNNPVKYRSIQIIQPQRVRYITFSQLEKSMVLSERLLLGIQGKFNITVPMTKQQTDQEGAHVGVTFLTKAHGLHIDYTPRYSWSWGGWGGSIPSRISANYEKIALLNSISCTGPIHRLQSILLSTKKDEMRAKRRSAVED